jgi:arsenite methyltransferase
MEKRTSSNPMISDRLSPEKIAEIRNAVQSKYKKVAISPEGLFVYPVGKEGALGLGYDPAWFEFAPPDAIAKFVGVGNPFKIRVPKPGDRVLDAGCGCGLDTFIAAYMAGPGKAIGLDLTSEMLAVARSSAEMFKNGNVEFYEGSLERLPFENNYFDMAISNGVLNLVPDKRAAFSEIARVLRPGGAFVAADLLVMEEMPHEELASTDAWST